jgi:hypothetical protein
VRHRRAAGPRQRRGCHRVRPALGAAAVSAGDGARCVEVGGTGGGGSGGSGSGGGGSGVVVGGVGGGCGGGAVCEEELAC